MKKENSLKTLQMALKSNNAFIIAANRRLTRYLINLLFPGPSPRVAPSINSVESWIGETWLELQDLGLPGANFALLTAEQECLIWRQLVKRNPQSTHTINPDALIDSLMQARTIIDGWNIPAESIAQFPLIETQYLQYQLEVFHQTLTSNGQITLETALRIISENLNDSKLKRYETLYLYGFTDLSPILQASLNSAANTITYLDDFELSAQNNVTVSVTKAVDLKQELSAAASWSQSKLEQDPTGVIGIIIPDLQAQRYQVEQVFTQQFDPQYFVDPSQHFTRAPFDISLGTALIDIPIVAGALDLFALIATEIERAQLFAVCQSYYWGNGIDPNRVSLLEALDSDPKFKYRTAKVRQLYREIEDTAGTPIAEHSIANKLIEAKTYLRTLPKHQIFSAWGRAIKHYLKILGWPGPRKLISVEFQACTQFFEWLENLAYLDFAFINGPELTLGDALSHIKSLLKKYIFHAESPPMPIQIMGLMEGAGLKFDYCWVLGMNDIQVPAKPKPNVLLPIQLQIQHATPRCSADKELQYAQTLIAHYCHCATEIIFSFSNTQENENTRVSPLLLDHPQKPIENFIGTRSKLSQYMNTQCGSHNYELFEDSQAPLINNDDPVGIRGGTACIKLHNTNPLYAFLVFRLGAREVNEPTLGIDPLIRGTIIHDSLAGIWSELNDSNQLKNLFANIEVVIDKNIENVFAKYDLSFISHQEIEQEKQRTSSIIYSWLEWETNRPTFAVFGCELKTSVTLAGRQLPVRLDRVDRLDNGELLVIDYKIGATSLTGIQRLPLADPQLPVYALALTDPVQGVAYAELNHSQVRLNGVGQLQQMPSGICLPKQLRGGEAPAEWADLIAWWRGDLEQSINEIISGYCPGETNNLANATFYSYLKPISREAEQISDFK